MIEKDGISFTLTPFQDEGLDTQVGSSVMLVGEKEFLKTVNEEGGGAYAIVIKPKTVMTTTSKVDDVPKEVQALLNKYKDIVVDELPSSLPPIRDVIHHIEFIPGENLPKKVAYKMTPQQNEQIRKQIQELLDKGLIRES